MLKFLLKPSTTVFEKIANVSLAFVFLIGWTIGVLAFYKYLFATETVGFSISIFPLDQFGFSYFKHPVLIQIFFACIMAPLWEELVFRNFPLKIIKSTGKNDLIISTILFTSIIFGLLHQGVPSILIQGVAGLVMSGLFIKNNWSYWSAVALHAVWNIALTFGIIYLLN